MSIFTKKPKKIWKEVKRENLGAFFDGGDPTMGGGDTMYKIAVYEVELNSGEKRVREVESLFPVEEPSLKEENDAFVAENNMLKAKIRDCMSLCHSFGSCEIGKEEPKIKIKSVLNCLNGYGKQAQELKQKKR